MFCRSLVEYFADWRKNRVGSCGRKFVMCPQGSCLRRAVVPHAAFVDAYVFRKIRGSCASEGRGFGDSLTGPAVR